MSRLSSAILSAFVIGTVVAQPALADERWHEHDRGGFRPHGYYLEHWRGGHWVHAWRDGRDGWWWVIEGAWYFYPVPVYPYPAPPAMVVAPAPQVAQPGYYYCPNPPGYYPTVPACATGWQVVPAVPVAPQPVPVPQPMPQAAPVAPPPPPPPSGYRQ